MRPLVAHIDLAAITHNYALARQCAPGRQALAVVKADAYGHGLEPVVAALSDADGFAVACLEEAERVRRVASQARLLLLEGCFAVAEYQRAAELGVDVVLHSAEQAEGLLASVLPAPLRVWLKLDSGMHRLGFDEAALRHWHARLQAASQVSELNLISHFACADERGNSLTELQLERFLDVLDLPFAQRSLANSAAVLMIPAAHMDWLRPGIMLYGASPFAEQSATELGLQSVMTLESAIIGVQELAPGERVGYGGTFTAERSMRIGVVACGYADGYPRHAPTGTPIAVMGRRTRTVGRVSMDMLACDLTDIPEAGIGAPVTLWGKGVAGEVPADEVAAAADTIAYELFCAVAPRVPVVLDLPAEGGR